MQSMGTEQIGSHQPRSGVHQREQEDNFSHVSEDKKEGLELLMQNDSEFIDSKLFESSIKNLLRGDGNSSQTKVPHENNSP